jgi:sialate O-acetylesterase
VKVNSVIKILTFVGAIVVGSVAQAQEEDWDRVLNLKGYWRFSIGDNKKWADPKYSDSDWENIEVPSNWEDEGFNGYNGYAWYRKTFDGSALENKNLNYNLFLGYIDDVDEVYINGHKIGYSGTFPPKYRTAYNAFRNYYIPKEYINFSGTNLIAVRVFDSEISGGIVSGDIGIYVNEDDRDLAVNLRGLWDFSIEEPMHGGSDHSDFLNTDKHVPPSGSKWTKMPVPAEWDHHGYNNFNGTAWYKKQFVIPKELEGEDLVLILGKIDDFDHTYFNGKWIGSTNFHDRIRIYTVPSDMFTAGAINILLVYVKDTQSRGGIYEGPVGFMKQADFTRYYRSRNR